MKRLDRQLVIPQRIGTKTLKYMVLPIDIEDLLNQLKDKRYKIDFKSRFGKNVRYQ